jgi:hypothetical protein
MGDFRAWATFRGSWRVVGLVVCVLVVLGTVLTPASANAASVLSPSPTSEDFGGVDMHFQQTMQEWFYNNSGSSVTVDPAGVKILGDTSSFSLQVGQDFCTGNTIPDGGSCHVNVLFGPLSSPGPKSATLELTDNTGTVDVPLTGTGFSGTLSLNQTSLDFGSQVIQGNNNGGSAQQSVTVATGPDFGVRVTNVQIIGADASSFSVQGNGCQGFTLGSNNTCQIYIQFQPLSAGSKQAQLEIDNDGTVSPLFVSLSGVGLNGPALSVSPKQAIFGNVLLGSSTSQAFTLTNVGDAPLQLQELFVASGSPQVFPMSDGCSGRQLGPGAACHVTVGFVPIAVGVKDATLFVISNQGPVSVIGLSGTGVAPNSGSSGASGATGPAGPTGPTPAGAAGKIVLVTCKTVTKTVTNMVSGKKHKAREKVHKCTGRRVGTTVQVTVSGPSGRATISRGRVVYATGTNLTIGGGRWLLLLTERRALKPGRYMLTLRRRHDGRWSTRRATIAIR